MAGDRRRGDRALRATGLALAAGGVVCLFALFRDPAAALAGSAAWRGALAAGGFAGTSLGTFLLALGGRIRDRVTMARGWNGFLPRWMPAEHPAITRPIVTRAPVWNVRPATGPERLAA